MKYWNYGAKVEKTVKVQTIRWITKRPITKLINQLIKHKINLETTINQDEHRDFNIQNSKRSGKPRDKMYYDIKSIIVI